MLKYFLAIIFAQVIAYSAPAQLKNIDSLKRALPFLHDSARVDCLDEIVYYFFQIAGYDSIARYLPLKYDEAKKLNYAHGLAVSLFQISAFDAIHYNYPEAEKAARESLYWYGFTNNKKYIEIAYDELGSALWVQSRYDEAIINLKQSYQWAEKAGSYDWSMNALDFMGQVYRESGKYDSAFYMYKQTLELTQRHKDTFATSQVYVSIGDLYRAVEDYSTALAYYKEAFKTRERKYISLSEYTTYAELFSLTNQFDSALHYYQSFDSASAGVNDLRIFMVSKGEYFFLQKKYDAALEYFLKGLAMNQQVNDSYQTERTLIDIAQTYAVKNDHEAALQYAKQAVTLALAKKVRDFARDGYKIIYAAYDTLQNTDSAYFYYRKYVDINALLLSDQVKLKLAAYNYEQKITKLDNEKQLGQQQLKQSAQQKLFLFIGIILVLIASFIIFRNVSLKRKNEKNLREIAENELQLQKFTSQQQLSELEMQVLRSQMNPHFIFNCLSSINRFILKNKTDEASDYLTKFSRLIRMVLNNSKQSFISLEDELETLRLYLEMERLRFRNSFDYSFTCKNSVDVGSIFVPPLLLQPFAENAIWHGLMNKQEKGFLHFDFSTEEKILTCVITDNGVGREQAELLKSKSAEKQKSMGLQITTERLSLLNKNTNEQTFFTIEDLADENGNATGTRVYLKIYFKQMIEA